jgi:colanic acid/amylovoran biosynthesis glycosyltransferase
MEKNNQKFLFLLCDNFPIGLGEFFLDDEVLIASAHFDRVIVLVPHQQSQSFEHPINEKIVVYNYEFRKKIKLILSSFIFFFSPITINEIFNQRKSTATVQLMKIIFVDLLKSSYLFNEVQRILDIEKIKFEECVFYSYWHDYKALTLARLSRRNKKGVYVSRAHSSDIFRFRSSYNYLPYKEFILTSLDKTFTVSEAGRKELLAYLKLKNYDKVEVSRLGKSNDRIPRIVKQSNKILICSCSHFNHLKRVHLIPEILKHLPYENLKWVHFGWGYPDYKEKVLEELKDAKFSYHLYGETNNEFILDYYHHNYVDLFINLSTHEGIPVSIMESLSAAIPVIATDVGGVSEIVDSSCGLLLPENFQVAQVAALIEKYLNASEDTLQSMRQGAYTKWLHHYSASENYTFFYEKLLELR